MSDSNDAEHAPRWFIHYPARLLAAAEAELKADAEPILVGALWCDWSLRDVQVHHRSIAIAAPDRAAAVIAMRQGRALSSNREAARLLIWC